MAGDCRPFIDFRLDAVGKSLYKHIDTANEMNDVPVDVPVNEVPDKTLDSLRSHQKDRSIAGIERPGVSVSRESLCNELSSLSLQRLS